MRNVQTQAQTRASVGPYADYKDGLIVLTGRGGEGPGGREGGGLQLQPQLSTVIAHHRQAKQVKSVAPVLPEDGTDRQREGWNVTCRACEVINGFD